MRDGCDILIILAAMRCRIRCKLSGRSAAWLARLVRDQEVEGSNPFAPTTFSLIFIGLLIMPLLPPKFVAQITMWKLKTESNSFYLVLPVANIFHQLLAIAASHAGVRVPHPVVNLVQHNLGRKARARPGPTVRGCVNSSVGVRSPSTLWYPESGIHRRSRCGRSFRFQRHSVLPPVMLRSVTNSTSAESASLKTIATVSCS
jgi:hypothetical protein